MAERARVGSIAALGTFRSDLVIFGTKSRENLSEAIDAVRRTRLWLQDEQRPYWEREVRRRQVVLDQAKQELLSARISTLRVDLTRQLTAVRKAEQALQDANEKVLRVKRWLRDYEHLTEPLLRQVQAFREVLDGDLPKAELFLAQAHESLEQYVGTFLGSAPIPPSAVSDEQPSEEEP